MVVMECGEKQGGTTILLECIACGGLDIRESLISFLKQIRFLIIATNLLVLNSIRLVNELYESIIH